MDPSDQPQQLPEAPDQETMEQIRRRRVAKLGEAKAPPSDTPKPEGAPSTSTSPAVGRKEVEAPPAAPRPVRTAETSIGITESSRKRARAVMIDESTTVSAPPRKVNITPRAEESLDDYANNQLNHIFRVTADPSRTTDMHGHKLIFLPNVHEELVEAGRPLRLTLDSLDSAILEAATSISHEKPLLYEYLLPCWKRATRAVKAYKGPSASPKEEVLKEARRLCFSNCIFALTMPELFGRESNPQHDTLMPYLLRGLDNEGGICLDFYNEALSRLAEDETVAPLFTKAMVDISIKLSTLTMNDDYKPYVNALLTYSKFPPLLNALAQDPRFQMAQSAPNVEKNTILGPFFRISPLQSDVTKAYFTGPRTLDKGPHQERPERAPDHAGRSPGGSPEHHQRVQCARASTRGIKYWTGLRMP